MAPQGSAGGVGEIDHTSAKHLLDSIGENVYKEVEKDAEKYKEALKGKLQEAKGSGETVAFSDTCKLVDDYYNNHVNGGDASGERNPCRKEDVKRFSDKEGAQCDKKKIRDNEDDRVGACAPYRRLHVCDKNMEKIATSMTTHKLLAEVCMAAKYEGASITLHYPQYQEKYGDSQICTVLARSFADIGDIIRGKDLFIGYNQKDRKEKQKIQDNLIEIFKKIHEDLTETGVKNYYKNDDKDPNFFQLREDWWIANRDQVWEAITCGAGVSQYFRPTCGDNRGFSQAHDKCTCNNGDVPTYFDYVPQFLRWFEEWAEDFCRKKNKKLKDAIDKCRGQDKSGNDKYCDLNGYDCEKTKRGRNIYRWDYKCTGCFLSCSHFRTWIDNQRKQFLKQRNKYQNEISVGGSGVRRQRRATRSNNNYEGYEKKFYEKLQSNGYGSVETFLEKLSKENVCTKITDTEGGTINFKTVNSGSASAGGDGSNKTFDHTTYCQACPLCGVKPNGRKWERKDNMQDCPPIKLYRPKSGEVGTTINFLYSGDEATEIGKKLNKFCLTQNGSDGGGGSKSDSQKLYQEWTCYHVNQLEKDPNPNGVDDPEYENDVRTGGGLCILPNPKKNEKEKESKSYPEPNDIQKTFNPFFYYWVVHMLKDSIYWRTKKLERCLKNGTTIKCKDGCKNPCKCFESWVKQKKEEWEKIKEQFSKQKDIKEETGMDPIVTLEWNLELEFANENTEEDKANNVSAEEAKEIKHLRDIIKKKNQDAAVAAGGSPDGKKKTIMDKLIEHEEGIATECKNCEQRQQNPSSVARAETPKDEGTQRPAEEEEEDEDAEDDDEDDEDEDSTENKAASEPEEPKEPKETAVDSQTPKVEVETVKPCDIVAELFEKPDTLQAACPTKYGPKAPTSWKCVTPSGDKTGTGGETTGKSDTGGLCIPPRRRRLYVGKLQEWASGGNTQEDGKAQTQPVIGEAAQGDGVSTSPQVALLHAFVKSAAVETFFAWHEFKKEKEREKKEKEEANGELVQRETSADTEQKELEESGKIPEEFKRQMFYTFGDYRDICLGKDIGRDMDKVNQKIKGVFSNNVQTPTEKQREEWWTEYCPHIWEGMLCALSYDTEKQNMILGLREKLRNTTNNNMYKDVTIISGDNTTKLEEFSKRPTFFRWLEEWGDEFCTKRTHKLANVKKECDGFNINGRKIYCSGDGYDCIDENSRYNDMFAHLDCRGCYTKCTNYKKWIKNKKNEFDNQKIKYKKEFQELSKPSKNDDDKKFHKYLDGKGYFSAQEFLQSPNHGKPCQGDMNKNNKINFNNNLETFGPSTYCKACPFNGVTCGRTGVCTRNSEIVQKNTGDPATVIDILLDNYATNDTDQELQGNCKQYELYKDLRKQKWECQKKQDKIHQCKISTDVDSNYFENKISFKVLFERWLIDFIEGYNKSKERITGCTKDVNSCKEGCNNKCECVKEWLNKKSTEWKIIREYYKEHLETPNDSIVYTIKTFFQQLPLDKDYKKAQEVVQEKNKRDELWGCTGRDKCITEETQKDKDFITNLINKLNDKIQFCQTQHGKAQAECDLPPLDDPEPPEEDPDTSTTSSRPEFCPQEQQPEPVPEQPVAPADEDDTDSGIQEEEEAAKPDQDNEVAPDKAEETLPPAKVPKVPKKPVPEKKVTPKRQPKKRLPREVTHSILPEMLSISSFPLTVGLAFAALSYFLLK
ncbi:hypothetical protein PFAG_06011, partial [Plasmodium falciparum Santa Lucia]